MIKYTLLFATLSFLFLSNTIADKKEIKSAIKNLNSNYAFVPSGSMMLDSHVVSIQSFIMFKTEIDNFDYNVFLNELKAAGELDKYKIAQIDTAKWSNGRALNEPLKTYYHSHPAYRNYPVVNISKEGAQLFCQWLTAKINRCLPEGQGIVFRLPTKAEWVMAARGGNEEAIYAWGGSSLRNENGQTQCNFLQLDAGNITRTQDGAFKVIIDDYFYAPAGLDVDILAPSESYWPNPYGIYNLNGNAAELLADSDEVIGGSWQDPGYDVRNESTKKCSSAQPNVGFRIVASVDPSKMTWLKVKK